MSDRFGLSDLEPGKLQPLLRHTMVTAMVLGVLALGVSIVLDQVLVAFGIAAGLAAGWANHRVLDRNVARVKATGAAGSSTSARRSIGSRTLARLGSITAVAVVLLLTAPPAGLGFVIGLVVFQIAFVANAAQAILAHGGG